MRSSLFIAIGIAFVGSTTIAVADSLPPIDPGSIPSQCTAVATVPPDATIPQPAIAARIALATCGAEVRFSALHLAPGEASIPALTEAARPSFELLDAAIKQNDPAWTSIAQKARADLFVSMAVRARNSIAPITMETLGESVSQHAALEPKIKAWLDQAH